jgi:hypothetical protein
MKLISTSALAKERDLDPKELFVQPLDSFSIRSIRLTFGLSLIFFV